MNMRGMAILLIMMGTTISSRAQEIRASAEITVHRYIVDAHVIDSRGRAVPNLGATDFRARLDGRACEVEAVEWIPAGEQARVNEVSAQADQDFARSPGRRTIVLFFQTDFQRMRIAGQMRMRHYAAEFIKTLGPEDRVAVVSHDSRLKLRQDFTSDQALLTKAIADSLLIDDPPPPSMSESISLFTGIAMSEANDASSPEQALLLIGKALQPIEGPKSMLLFGWGLGHFSRAGVQMDWRYAAAKYALDRSRTSVFTLDISNADYHSLEAGLSKTSRDTGGFYMKTHLFPQMAMDRISGAISGRYEITLKSLHGGRASHVDLKMPKIDGEIFYRRLLPEAR